MQGDTITSKKNEQENAATQDQDSTGQESSDQAAANPTETSASTSVHLYYEVGNDLLSKPNALSDLVQSMGCPATVVFCNSPSEADMVDVMLKKRSIPSCKLIGHVPYGKVAQAVQQTKQKEMVVVVVTDIAARDLDLALFEVVVNYSINEEPEIYLHRMTAHQSVNNPPKIISLVGSNDFANFHYLKKIVNLKFTKAELPSKEEIANGEAQRVISQALVTDYTTNERVRLFLPAILSHAQKEQIVAYLLHNTLNVLPGLQGSSEKTDDRQGDRRFDGGSRDNRWERQGQGRDRDDRDRRRDSRDEDDHYSGGPRREGGQGGGRFRDMPEDDTDRYEPRGRERAPRREFTPPKRDIRVYLGHGAKDGFSEERFTNLVKEHCAVESANLKRFSLRDYYAFVDVSEEVVEKLLEDLENSEINPGQKIVCKKATVITAPRDEARGEEAQEGEERDRDNAPEGGGRPHPRDEKPAAETDVDLDDEAIEQD